MKNSTLVAICLLLSSTTFGQNIYALNSEKNCSFSDQKVNNTLATEWISAWKDSLTSITSATKIKALGNDALYRTLGYWDLYALSISPDTTLKLGAPPNGIRIYFGKKTTTKNNEEYIPDLLLVNAFGCIDDEKISVLMLGQDKKNSWLDQKTAITYINNWRISKYNSPELYTVDAYTFNLDTVSHMYDLPINNAKGVFAANPIDIRIYFAIHNLDIDSTGKLLENYGNTVMVDLLLLPYSEGVKNPGNAVAKEYMDFAQPCPKICPVAISEYNYKGSPYYQATQTPLTNSIKSNE